MPVPARYVLADGSDAALRCAAAGHRRRSRSNSRCRGRHQVRVHTLRSFDDSRGIAARAASARCALVIGSSFIGLEVAASLVGRGIEVHVVAPEAVPMQRVLGPELGRFRPRSA